MREARPDALVEIDRTRDARPDAWSRNWPDALVKPSNAPAKQRLDAHARWTGRHSASVRLESSKLPQWSDASGRSWPDAPPRPIRKPRHAQTLNTDRTRPVKTETASGPTSGHLCDLCSPPFDSPFHIWARLSMCVTLAHVLARETTCDNTSKSRTRFSVWPDILHPASGQSPESSHHDRTRPIARDRMRHASDWLYVKHCTSRRLTRRSGSVRDRTRWLRTLLLRPRWTDQTRWSGQTSVRSQTLGALCWTDRTRPVKPGPRPVQCPVTTVTTVRLRFFSDFAKVLTSPSVHRHVHVC
jgi:hypothetical protein